jgi:hypothetical protein
MRGVSVVPMASAAALALALAGCGDSGKETKTTVDLTFYLAPTVAPTTVVANQDYVVSWNLFNSDQLGGHVDNVAWTVSRDGIPDVFNGVVPTLVSHQPVALSLTDNQPVGTHTYVITIDPANAVRELTKSNNTRIVTVIVQTLTIQ